MLMSFRALSLIAAALVLLAASPAETYESTQLRWHSFRLNSALNPVVTVPHAPEAPAWQFDTGDGISSSPTVANDMVLIASNDHTLYALNVANGKPVWTFTAGNQIMSAPIIDGNVAIIGEGDRVPVVWAPPKYVALGIGSSALHGIDITTGKQLWWFGLAGTGMPSCIVVDGVLLHHDGSGMVLALDPQTGQYLWRKDIGSVAGMTDPVLMGRGDLFLTAGYYPNKVVAMHAHTGAIAWSTEFNERLNGFSDVPLAVDSERAYGEYVEPIDKSIPYAEDNTHVRQHFYALRLSDGKIQWDIATVSGVAPPKNKAAIPMMYNGVLYAGTSIAPTVHAIDPATGKVLWQTQVRGTVKGGLVAHAGIVYLGDLGGYLWAIDAATGRVVGAKRTSLHFNVGSPIIVNESLIMGSNEGTVVSIPLTEIRNSHDDSRGNN